MSHNNTSGETVVNTGLHEEEKAELSSDAKRLRACSIGLKIFAILMIISIVICVSFLPGYLQNKAAEDYKNSNIDPTNARLPNMSMPYIPSQQNSTTTTKI